LGLSVCPFDIESEDGSDNGACPYLEETPSRGLHTAS
jgi:hypothetical protein